MGSKKFLALLLVLLFVAALAPPAFAQGELVLLNDNLVFFRNFENWFDADGNWVQPGSREPQVGDHFFGIIDIQNINIPGASNHWWSGPEMQLTGLFAQRVEEVVDPDVFNLYGIEPSPHIVLGAPMVTTFCKGADCVDTSAILEPGEMFAIFSQSGAGATAFETNGPMADDVMKATDGDLWLTLAYSPGGDGMYATGDDDGYFYSHFDAVALSNFTGWSWGALNHVRNNTGYNFSGVNDPNEMEMGSFSGVIPLLQTSIHLSSELEGNPNGTLLGGTSPWELRSNDPAHMFPVPEREPGNCRVTVGGNKDTVCISEGDFLVPETCADDEIDKSDISHTWGGQAGSPPRIDCNWTHHYKEPAGDFGFHSTACFYIECSDEGEQCVAADGNPDTRQIDFAGLGVFTHTKGVYDVFPSERLCFEVHLEDIGEPGRGGKNSNSDRDCEHCPGNTIVNYDMATGRNDCEDCKDYYEIRIYDSSAVDPGLDRCAGNLIWTNGPQGPHPNCATDTAGQALPPSQWLVNPRLSGMPFFGFFTRAGNVQMHPDKNGGGPAQSFEVFCNNGIDDDGDGKIDCVDKADCKNDLACQ